MNKITLPICGSHSTAGLRADKARSDTSIAQVLHFGRGSKTAVIWKSPSPSIKTNSWQFSPKIFAEKKKHFCFLFVFWHFNAGALHSADFGDQGIYEVIQITCSNFILQFSGLSGNLHIRNIQQFCFNLHITFNNFDQSVSTILIKSVSTILIKVFPSFYMHFFNEIQISTHSTTEVWGTSGPRFLVGGPSI